MTPDEIRKISFPKHEFGNPPSEVHEFLGAMLQEIAAQQAAQTEYLLKVLDHNQKIMDHVKERDAKALAFDEEEAKRRAERQAWDRRIFAPKDKGEQGG